MAVGGLHAVAVVDHDVLAVDPVLPGPHHPAPPRGVHRRADGHGDVDTLVELAALQGGVAAVPEAAADAGLGVHGPDEVQGRGQGEELAAGGLGAAGLGLGQEGLVGGEAAGGGHARGLGPGDGAVPELGAEQPGLEGGVGGEAAVRAEALELGLGLGAVLHPHCREEGRGPARRPLGHGTLGQGLADVAHQLLAEIDAEGGQQVHGCHVAHEAGEVGGHGAHGSPGPGSAQDQGAEGQLGEAGEGQAEALEQAHGSHPHTGRPCTRASTPTGVRMRQRSRPRLQRSGGSRAATARHQAPRP